MAHTGFLAAGGAVLYSGRRFLKWAYRPLPLWWPHGGQRRHLEYGGIPPASRCSWRRWVLQMQRGYWAESTAWSGRWQSHGTCWRSVGFLLDLIGWGTGLGRGAATGPRAEVAIPLLSSVSDHFTGKRRWHCCSQKVHVNDSQCALLPAPLRFSCSLSCVRRLSSQLFRLLPEVNFLLSLCCSNSYSCFFLTSTLYWSSAPWASRLASHQTHLGDRTESESELH